MIETVLIFSHRTGKGTFEIAADKAVFEIGPKSAEKLYFLVNRHYPDYRSLHATPYEAILAVSQHRIGLQEWDESPEAVSDYAADWERHSDKRFQMRLLDSYLAARPKDTMREIVDYFEGRHFYFLDRMIIEDLFVELVTTFQIEKLPSMDMAPAEMTQLKRLADNWLHGDRQK